MTWRVITYAGRMGRWDPDARGRLERAALELFTERGFAETTVPEIAARAGLTTRTFFRYFKDKREVIFADEDQTRERLVDFVRRAPDGLSPVAMMVVALQEAAEAVFEPRRDAIRQWRAVVAGDEGLRERALRKQELMVDAAVSAMHDRGVDADTADMSARAAVIVFETAVGTWAEADVAEQPLSHHVRDAFARLRRAVTDD